MQCDEVDLKILQALLNDGRASLRQIAERTSLTTPTVSSRLTRMLKSGTIKKFVPILSSDSVHGGIAALVTLKMESSYAQKIAEKLAGLREVDSVYMTTGESITIKVSLESVQELKSFLAVNIPKKGVKVTSSQIIIGTLKEELPSLIPKELTMNLRCDFCDGPITSRRPHTIGSGHSRYYFCCKTCKKDYLIEHGGKIPA